MNWYSLERVRWILYTQITGNEVMNIDIICNFGNSLLTIIENMICKSEYH